MSDNNDLEIKIGADASGVSPELEALKAKLTELGTKIEGLNTAMRANTTATRQLTESQSQAEREAQRLSAAQERFTRTLKLQADTIGLNRAEIAAYKAEQLGLGASPEVQASLTKLQTGLSKVHANSRAVTESFVLMREASRGNFTRMAGSVSILLQSLQVELLPIALAVGAAFVTAGAAFEVLHVNLARGIPNDLTRGLHLTEDQLKNVKDKTVTLGDTVQAVFKVAGERIQNTFGGTFKQAHTIFDQFIYFVGEWGEKLLAVIGANFRASYTLIVDAWSRLPAAVGDIFYSMANQAIANVNRILSVIRDAVNAMGNLAGQKNLIGDLSLKSLNNPFANGVSSAGQIANDVSSAWKKGYKDSLAALDQFGKDVAKKSQQIARARIAEEAGPAKRGAIDHSAEDAARDRAELALESANAQSKIDEERVRATEDAATDELNAKIEAKRAEISATRVFNAQDLANLQDLYNRRETVIEAAIASEAQIARTRLEAQKIYDQAMHDPAGVKRDEDEIALINLQTDNKILASRRKTAADIQKATEQSVRAQVDAYRRMATQIGDTFRTMIEGLIQRTMSWRDVWIEMQRKMLDFGLRTLQQWIVNFIVRKREEVLAQKAANAEKEASDKGAAIAAGQISFKSALTQIGNDARLAAAGAYKATVGIPIIGPVLAPAAAATAFAGVAAFEGALTAFSAENGAGSVPYDNAPFLLHKNEMVLPANIATPLRAMLSNNGGSSGSSVTNNSRGGDTFHIHAIKGMSVDDIVTAIKQARRQNKLTPGMAF